MATLFSDNFNRADNPSLGPDWTERGASVNVDIVTNRAEFITVPSADIGGAHTAAYGTADYTVQGIINPPAGSSYYGMVGRRVNFSTNDSDCYFGLINELDDTLSLYKRVAGIYTSLGSFVVTITAGTDYTVKLSMQGTTIKLFLAGVERISVTDGALTANGSAGIMMDTAGSAGGRYDDVLVEDFGTSATGRPPFGLCLVGIQ